MGRETQSEAGMGNPIKVAIVDSDEEFCRMVCAWLEDTDDILVMADAPRGLEVLRWGHEVRPDVVLMDVAAASTAQVRAAAAHAGVIVLHGVGQEPLVLEALRAGALGHLEKPDLRPAQVLAAIRAVSRGQAVLSPGLAGQVLDEVVLRLKRENLKTGD